MQTAPSGARTRARMNERLTTPVKLTSSPSEKTRLGGRAVGLRASVEVAIALTAVMAMVSNASLRW